MLRITTTYIAFVLQKSANTVRHDLSKRKIYLNEPLLIKKGAVERVTRELVQYLMEEFDKKDKKKTFKTTQKAPSICRKANKATWAKKEDKNREIIYDVEGWEDPPGYVEPSEDDIVVDNVKPV